MCMLVVVVSQSVLRTFICAAVSCCVLYRHLSEGKRYRSAIKPRTGLRYVSVRVRQSCRLTARLHAQSYHDSDITKALFVGAFACVFVFSRHFGGLLFVAAYLCS